MGCRSTAAVRTATQSRSRSTRTRHLYPLRPKKLAEAHERATFFDVGRSIDNWPGYLTRELKVGAVEDHTYTHVALIALPPNQITYQPQATAEKIQTETGEHVQLWRPPYELHDATVDRIGSSTF